MKEELEPAQSGPPDDEHELDHSTPISQELEESKNLSAETVVKELRKPFLARILNGMGIKTSPAGEMILDWVQVLVIAGFLAWFTMSYAMVRMRVPTPSMEPAIQVGDSFFVDKLTYGLGINEAEPGDIIVFWHTNQFQRCKENSFLLWRWGELKPCKERFVKRLIAQGPATIEIRQGNVIVNGEIKSEPPYDRDYVCSLSESTEVPTNRAGCEFEIDAGEWFVLGDNTPNSNDSRFWGPLNADDFIGEPFFRVWPLGRIGPMNGYFGSPR